VLGVFQLILGMPRPFFPSRQVAENLPLASHEHTAKRSSTAPPRQFFDQCCMRKVRLLVLRTGTLFFCLT
jgi:hypothetical protein